MRKLCLTWLGLLLLAAPAAVKAQFTCTTNSDNTLTITGYAGPGGAVDIPSTIGELSVSMIGTNAFADNADVTSVTTPASLNSIEDFAFAECSSLSSIEISSGVTNIGQGAFIFCHALASVSIPSSVASVGIVAFQGCSALTNAGISNGVASLGDAAFEGCNGLTNLAIPASLANIGENVFANCRNLVHLSLASGLPSIGAGMFELCQSLTNIVIPASVTNIGDHAFFSSSVNGVIIPKGVSAIGPAAFSLTLLGAVTIHSSITNIGEGAFSFCPRLTNITVARNNPIYSSVNGVLFDKTQDTLITYPAGLSGTYAVPATVTDVAGSAFGGGSLSNVVFYSGVTNIGDNAFTDCAQLDYLIFQGNAPAADPTAFDYDTNAVIYYYPGATGWSSPFDGLRAFLWNASIQNGGLDFGVRSNQFGFNITGTSNIVLVLQENTNLAGASWLAAQNIKLSNGLYYFSQPRQTNATGHFYRLAPP